MSKAIVIPASQHFEGADGPWSTFDLRIGTPEQYVRVLVSTASPHSIVALSDSACSTDVFETVPPDCAVSRGNLFNLDDSSSWDDLGLFGINQDGFGLEANLGYEQRAQFGLDRLGIGLTGPEVENQVVAGIATPEPFYLGIIGLNLQPMNFTSLGNTPTTSLITTLRDQSLIPSLTWAYTAGARYRLKQVYGQLVLSGYDVGRFEENAVSFTMADDVTRDLVVALQSISYNGATSETLLSDSIDIFIDSTDPNIWLPNETCDAFEQAFGLSLDEESGLYLVNDTHHNSLLDSGAEVTFRLSDVEEGGETVSVTLPYAAFDLTAEYPLTDDSTHYFPLRRADNSSQYTLGRVFLQEAYLSADYERNVFNVSACLWNEGAEESLVTIASMDSGQGTGNDPTSPKNEGLSGGALAGVIAGAVIGGMLLLVVAGIIILRKRRKWMRTGYAVEVGDRPSNVSDMSQPVFTSAPHSTPDKSESMSTRDVSAPTSGRITRSTPSSSDTPTVMPPIASSPAPTELDGQHTEVRPASELDGKEVLSIPATARYVGPLPVLDETRPQEGRIRPTVDIPAQRSVKGQSSLHPEPVSAIGTSSSWDDMDVTVSPR